MSDKRDAAIQWVDRIRRAALRWLRGQIPGLERWGASGLLLTVAGIHAYLVVTEDLTQWKGGGFGMFSTVDAGGARIFRIDLESDGVRYSAALPDRKDVRDLMRLARRLPSDRHVNALVEFLADSVWVARDREAARPSVAVPARPQNEPAATDPAEILAEHRKECQADGSVRDLVNLGRDRPQLVPWDPTRSWRGRIHRVDRVVLSLYKLRYSRSTREVSLTLVKTREAEGIGLEAISEAVDLPVDYVENNWLASRR